MNSLGFSLFFWRIHLAAAAKKKPLTKTLIDTRAPRHVLLSPPSARYLLKVEIILKINFRHEDKHTPCFGCGGDVLW